MFKNPFSFEGRIRRSEFGLSLIIYAVFVIIINIIIDVTDGDAGFLAVAIIPLLWFSWAQGAKRCHDVGNSGWMQLVPFYIFWLLFQDGDRGHNNYGENPKENNNTVGYSNNTGNSYNRNVASGSNQGNSYQGGYSGGHNNPNINQNFNANQQSPQKNNNNSSGYKNGDLYN